MRKVIYYWYNHGLPEDIIDKVTKAIKEHDFHKFMKYYNYLNNLYIDTDGRLIFLPDHAFVFEGDDLVDTISVLIQENFDMIKGVDNEHG